VETSQSVSTEVGKTGPCQLDLSTDAFKGTRGLLPGLRNLDRIAWDQLQGRTARQCLPQHHPRLHPLSLGGTRDFTDTRRATP
jgi:hypothetical protein